MRVTQALKNLFRPRAADPALDDRYWPPEYHVAKSGQLVSQPAAEQYITLQACVDLFKRAFLMLPPQVLRYTERGKFEVPNHPAGQILRKRPNPYQKPYQFKALLMHQALVAGNAFAELKRGAEGLELWPLAPAAVEGPELLPNGRRRYKVTRDNGQKDLLIGDAEIMHVTGLWTDGLRGKSIVERAREALGLALAAESAGAKLFASGVKHPGVIKMPGVLSKPELREDISRSFKRQAEIGYPLLEQGMEFQSMGMNADDAQMLETRKFSVIEIARLFGIPPHMIGDLEKNTSWGTGIESMTFAFVTYALLPWLVIWQECFEAMLVTEPDVFIRFNVGKLMQADMTTRFSVYEKAIINGIYSPNECRELEDRNPREGGDVYLTPLNMRQNDEPRGQRPNPPPREEPAEDEEARAQIAKLAAQVGELAQRIEAQPPGLEPMLDEQADRLKKLAAIRDGAAALGIPETQVRKLIAHAKSKEKERQAGAEG